MFLPKYTARLGQCSFRCARGEPLFEPEIARLDLWNPPASHRDGPIFLNVLRFLDMPQAVAMAAERSQVRLYDEAGAWRYALEVAEGLGWEQERLQVRRLEENAAGEPE